MQLGGWWAHREVVEDYRRTSRPGAAHARVHHGQVRIVDPALVHARWPVQQTDATWQKERGVREVVAGVRFAETLATSPPPPPLLAL